MAMLNNEVAVCEGVFVFLDVFLGVALERWTIGRKAKGSKGFFKELTAFRLVKTILLHHDI